MVHRILANIGNYQHMINYRMNFLEFKGSCTLNLFIERLCSTHMDDQEFVHMLCTRMVTVQFPVWAGIK